MRDQRYVVSTAPHIRHGRTARTMILTTIAALTPAALWGFYQFGFSAVVLIVAGIVGAVGAEAVIDKIAKRQSSLRDGHALLVGLTLALLIPAGAPFWLVLIGAIIAILIGKAPFGPLGGAPLSPALVGLLIVTVSWPDQITSYVQPRSADPALKAPDAAPAEHPQDAVHIDPSDVDEYDLDELLLGNQVGPIGTICPLLLLVGGLFLLIRRAARWHAPAGFILGIAVTAAIAHSIDPGAYAPAWFHILTGTAMFGAFFLCTEWTSTPVTPRGLFLFGLLAGMLVIVFRMSGLPFARVPFAIVLMSLCTPLFDRIAQAPLGKVTSHA
ncbi:MAG: RnfABCDGE type electron transport complex subunit D [Proteobacteria bacterium]|nr:RnfABCDGE type electron transport complex subunit D [Pseudomonadota bacterium]